MIHRSGCLLDTGPLVALLGKSEACHEKIKVVFSEIEPPFFTCEAVITEAYYLLSKMDLNASCGLLQLAERGVYQIKFGLGDHFKEVQSLLLKYHNVPISLADACLIRMAEIHEEPRIFTFDSDFEIYRWGRNKKFHLL